MKIFEAISKYGHEQIVFCHEETTGLKAVIAIHNTILGPALGGCRMWPFESEDEAIADAVTQSHEEIRRKWNVLEHRHRNGD